MFNISNYKWTSLTRKVTESELRIDYLTKSGCVCYTVSVFDWENELVELRKTTMYQFVDGQLIDPATGERKTTQNESETYISEFEHMDAEIISKWARQAMIDKITILDTEWLI